jgi:hypothetical protein
MVSRLLSYGTWIRRPGVGIADRPPEDILARAVDVSEPSAASHNSTGPRFAYALHMTVTHRRGRCSTDFGSSSRGAPVSDRRLITAFWT